MSLVQKTFYNEADLIAHIKSHTPSFYFSSRTSTVVPYDKLAEFFGDTQVVLCDLSKLPLTYEVTERKSLKVRGPWSWRDARIYLKSIGRNIMTSPTEELALISAGAATSCTGERCFAFGNLRSQIISLKYWDYNGEERELRRDRKLNFNDATFTQYQTQFAHFKNFKNAPYPRFETETDLMIGTEGQLGVISEIEIETVENFPASYFFIQVPKWEENIDAHLEIFAKVQTFRGDIISCEMIDHKSLSYLKPEDRLVQNHDVIFIEVKTDKFEKVFEDFLSGLTQVSENDIFELSLEKFQHVRASVPRAIFEENSRKGVVKMGTDVQVEAHHFSDLLKHYRLMASAGLEQGIEYNLFGHFGDAHLHFNFMPKKENASACIPLLEGLYKKVVEWHGSPFAEHGIGFLKQKYIRAFYTSTQYEVFKKLKLQHDPHSQFFPKGFMSLTQK
jgi:FAD/FMN-containing dehydrogenase